MDKKIIWLDSVDSTNSYSIKNYHALNNFTLVCANHQTHGKGRREHTWYSPKNKNLYASFILKDIQIDPLKMLMASSLALLNILRHFSNNDKFKIKWPNDIFFDNKKIAGILAESYICEGKIEGVVIGIGLNVNMTEAELKPIEKPATSLLITTGNEYNIKEISTILYHDLIEFTNQAQVLKNSYIYEKWKSENFIIGKQIEILKDDKTCIHGKVVDIKESGSLYVFDDNGNFHTFDSGDVTIISF